MGKGEAPTRQIRKQRLHIPKNGFPGRGVANVADCIPPREPINDRGLGEVFTDQSHPSFGEELLPVRAHHACRFLTPVLQCVQAQGRHRSGIRMPEDPEHTTLFAQPVRVTAHELLLFIQRGEIELGNLHVQPDQTMNSPNEFRRSP